MVEDFEEEAPTDLSSKPKKVCDPSITQTESHADRVRKGKKKKKQPANDPIAQNPSRSNASKKSKKQKPKPGQSNDNQDFDKILAELSQDWHGLQLAAGGPSIPGPSPHKRLAALLSISPQHLDGELEMRKFFGSKVVVSSRVASRTASKRVNAAFRSTLTNPKPNWWPSQLREGLSVRQLTPDEREDKLFRYGWSDRPEEVWWTVEYGKKYRAITMAFMRTVMSGGKWSDGRPWVWPNGLQILTGSTTSYVRNPIMPTPCSNSQKCTVIEKVLRLVPYRSASSDAQQNTAPPPTSLTEPFSATSELSWEHSILWADVTGWISTASRIGRSFWQSIVNSCGSYLPSGPTSW